MRLALIALIAWSFASSPAVAAEKDWSWFVASSIIDDWVVKQGAAKVRLTNDTFSAELRSDTGLVYRLSGSRKGNRINATLSTEDSDIGDRQVMGEYRRTIYKDKNFPTDGRETIQLSMPHLVVGLTREIDRK